MTHTFESHDPMGTALSFALTYCVRRVVGETKFEIKVTPLVFDPETFRPMRAFLFKPISGSTKRMDTQLDVELIQDVSVLGNTSEYDMFDNLINNLAKEVANYYQPSPPL